MKDKQFEYDLLAGQIRGSNQVRDTERSIYPTLVEHAKGASVSLWLVCIIIGYCLFFNYGVNWLFSLIIVVVLRFCIDIYCIHKKDRYERKLFLENAVRDDLREICSGATNFRVEIILKTPEYSKQNKQADTTKAKQYYNHISLFKVADGWIFSGRRPVYLQKDLAKESEIVFVHETNKFIKNDTTQVVMFPIPKKNSSKQIYAKFYLSVNDEYIKLEESYLDHTELKRNDCGLGDIYIDIDSIKNKVYKRIVAAYQPYNDACNSAKPHTPESKECGDNIQNFRFSEEFAKLKFAPLNTEKTKGVLLQDVSFTPKHKNSYSHKYNENVDSLITGAIHTYETEFFIVKIFQGQTYQGVA